MCDPRPQQQPHQPSLRQVALTPAIHPIAVLPDDPVAVPLEQAALTVGAERLGRVAGEGGRLVVIVQVVSSHLSAPFTLGRSWSAPHCRVTPSAFNWLLPYRAVPTAPPAATRTRYSSSRAPRRREAGRAAHKPKGKPGGTPRPQIGRGAVAGSGERVTCASGVTGGVVDDSLGVTPLRMARRRFRRCRAYSVKHARHQRWRVTRG